MSNSNIVHLSLSALKAALGVAAKQDIRYYLNGVLIESGPNITRTVSTDGRMLFAHDYPFSPDEPQWCGRMIVSRDVVEMLVKPRAIVDVAQIEVLKLATHKDAVHEVEEAQFVFPAKIGFKPMSGVFPDYCRVIPEKVSGKAAFFNPELIAAMDKAARIISGTKYKLVIYQNGEGGALVDLGHGAVGVIMPMRNKDGVAPNPAQFRERLAVTQPATA